MNAPTELLELAAYTFLLQLLFVSSLVNPLGISPRRSSPSIRSRLLAFHSVPQTGFIDTVYTPSTILRRQPEPHWHLHFTRSISLAPAFAVVHNLEDLYTAIVDIAQDNHSANQPQFNELRFWEGHRECVEFHSLVPIPWQAIWSFAVSMLALVRRGRIDGSYEGFMDSGLGDLIAFRMTFGPTAG